MTKEQKLTDFICQPCRKATAEKRTHPGANHVAGICDCRCRDE